MKRRKAGAIKLLAHERLVSVSYYGKTILGYAFGQSPLGQIIVCLSKPELIEVGIDCKGPCINQFFAKSDVKFLDASKMKMIIEEEGEPDELDPDTAVSASADTDRVVLDVQPVETKKKRLKKVKTKKFTVDAKKAKKVKSK